MANSPIGQFLLALETKLQSVSDITLNANVMIGETPSLVDLPNTAYPRMEVLITKDKGDGYNAQRYINFAFRFSIAGYMKRIDDGVSFADMTRLMNFGQRTRNAVFGMLDDKQAGSLTVPGFEKFAGYPETFYEFEIFYEAELMSFILEMEAHFNLKDVEAI